MFGGKKQAPAQIYVEQLWKGVARSTLLEAQLHISNLKPQQRHHDGHIYPQWWGHEEYYQEGYSQAFAEKNKIVEQQHSAADNAQRATAAPAAGLKTQRGPVSLFPVICEHFPKKMIDENTQTDDSLLNLPLSHHQKPPLPSKIPIASYSGFMDGGGGVIVEPPLASPPKAKKPSVIATKVAKKFVPRRASANAHSASVLTEPASNSAIFASLLKEAAETPLEMSYSTNISVKPIVSRQQQASLETKPKTDVKAQEEEDHHLDTQMTFSPAPTVKSMSSPFPERSVPPVDGTYSVASNFLNGPIVSLLEYEGLLPSDSVHGPHGVADQPHHSLLLNSTSFWLDQTSVSL